jgi:peroxiredoxin
MRGKRFALYADNGVVKQLHVEAPGEFKVSAADAMLDALT